jgi:F-type H+-transporting ATPase subunit alpha
LEAFAKFGSDLDAATKAVIDKGKRNVEILKQPQYSPLTVEKQVAIIYLGSKGLLRNVAVEKVRTFESDFLSALEAKHPEVLAEFKKGGLSDEATGKVEALAKSMEGGYA